MGCGSGCCAPPADVPAAATENIPGPPPVSESESVGKQSEGGSDSHMEFNQGVDPSNFLLQLPGSNSGSGESVLGCQGGCCGGAAGTEKAGDVGDCFRPKTAEEDCVDDCCGGAAGKGKTVEVDDCCAPETAEESCADGCCGSDDGSAGATGLKKADLDGTPAEPDCCAGKTSPCCDTTCLDRLALRQCESGSTLTEAHEVAATKSTAPSGCHEAQDGRPCDRHLRSSRERYGATLEALGCICRTLLAVGQESCCVPRERSSLERRRGSKKTVARAAAADRCCSGDAEATLENNGCCAATPTPKEKSCSQGCCGPSKAPSIVGSCNDSCCGEVTTSRSADKLADVSTTLAPVSDPEKGLSGREHVILSISGMTCTGCETKLKRTLGTLDAVQNLKTSLVLSRAEFDLDLAASSAVDVMKHLERTTEFKCERVTSQGSGLDVVTPGSSDEFVNQAWPEGVTAMQVVDETTVHVAFDAKVVGARDLVERGWDTPLQLAPLRPDPTLEAGSRHVRHVGYMTILSTVLTIPVLVMAWAPLPEHELAYASASLALATLVQVAIAGPFYSKALKSLVFSRMVEMDLLIVLSTSAAYVFSVVSFGYLVAGQPLSTGQFFETSTLLVTLIMVGRYVSAFARQKAVESISVRSLQTSTATLVSPSGGPDREIDVRLLQHGDTFAVPPESRIPTDGTVVAGASDVDESMLTGESLPVAKRPGAAVVAGSLNGPGALRVRLTRLPGDNTISAIAAMVDEAKLAKPRIQALADRVAGYFVPVVVGLTLVTLVVWIALGVGVRGQSGGEAAIRAITYAITVLIVSCPCAIGLAVPMVVVIAGGVAAERGVVFKSAEAIECAERTTHVVFDKTGTLTEGKLTVVSAAFPGEDVGAAKALLLGLVSSSKHPVSAAVAAYLKAEGIEPATVQDAKSLPGKGMRGTSPSGALLHAGNPHWLSLPLPHPHLLALPPNHTLIAFTINASLAATFALHDSPRPDAAPTVAALHARGIHVHILSGDEPGAVLAVASQLAIPAENVRARASPADKDAYIRELSAPSPTGGKKKASRGPVVMFVGDGTNDAVALAQASVGVHINRGGADVAQAAADVVLLRPALGGVLSVIRVSERAVGRMRFNFVWSGVYNLFAVLLGAGAFEGVGSGGVRIPPEFAGLGEVVSVLPVVLAAVALRWERV